MTLSQKIAAVLILVGVLSVLINRALSKNGIDKIKQYEALRLAPYWDEKGLWTIGYGHLIKAGEHFADGIDEATADRLLRADVADAERAVKTLVLVPLTQNQYDALVSFVYNTGAGAFASSAMLRLLNGGAYAAAAEQFARWNKINVDGTLVASVGLAGRRARERDLFLAA